MARNQVMKLWTVVITAFLALFTALGLITTTAAAAVPQTQPPATAPSPTRSPWLCPTASGPTSDPCRPR